MYISHAHAQLLGVSKMHLCSVVWWASWTRHAGAHVQLLKKCSSVVQGCVWSLVSMLHTNNDVIDDVLCVFVQANTWTHPVACVCIKGFCVSHGTSHTSLWVKQCLAYCIAVGQSVVHIFQAINQCDSCFAHISFWRNVIKFNDQTGDAEETAVAIATSVGFYDKSLCHRTLSGPEMERMSSAELEVYNIQTSSLSYIDLCLCRLCFCFCACTESCTPWKTTQAVLMRRIQSK